MRRITSRYPFKCRKCGKQYSAGADCFWAKGQKPVCPDCYSGNSSADSVKSAPSKVKPTPKRKFDSEEYFTIDWADFKEILKRALIDDKAPEFQVSGNRSRFMEWVRRSGSFTGVSLGQMQRWITEGFRTDSIKGLSEFTPPIRDKRKLIFGEEGDEFHFDISAGGDENYMSHFTRKEQIPGVSISAGIMFAGMVDAETVAAYNTWICKVAYSLESAGIDLEITLDFPSWNLRESGTRISAGQGTLWHNLVRVKKENEASDFLSWSAMMSPAALRNFGFALGTLHCDSKGVQVSHSFGRGVPERHSWNCRYNHERRTIEIVNAYMDSGKFPEERMTKEFRECLKKMQGKHSNNPSSD
jgi:hypothetical protein